MNDATTVTTETFEMSVLFENSVGIVLIGFYLTMLQSISTALLQWTGTVSVTIEVVTEILGALLPAMTSL